MFVDTVKRRAVESYWGSIVGGAGSRKSGRRGNFFYCFVLKILSAIKYLFDGNDDECCVGFRYFVFSCHNYGQTGRRHK